MQELRFDSIVYHFYYASRSEDGTRAMDAGFTWDPTRGRYYTADPQNRRRVIELERASLVTYIVIGRAQPNQFQH
jgi:hypothetical protein